MTGFRTTTKISIGFIGVALLTIVTGLAALRYADTWWGAAAIVAPGVGLIVWLRVAIARAIARPLVRAVDVLEAIAAGDFTRRLDVESGDELGRLATALNRALEGVRAALQDVRMAAHEAAAVSRQLSVASDRLGSGVQQQAASLEETASSLEEITGTVKQTADNARQANQLAAGARDIADRGGQVVATAVEAMAAINQASKKIADIITTIDEIAFQTNLLALNAAVEAARAGEQGRGFAVVAAEVRNLAQRSATAAKEIKALIHDSVGKVEAGSDLVNQSGRTLEDIVGSVKRVTDIIAEIAAASGEQSTGIDQVNRAVNEMDQAVHANATQTEELSSTAQALASRAHELQALVGRFTLSAPENGTPSSRSGASSDVVGSSGARASSAVAGSSGVAGSRTSSARSGVGTSPSTPAPPYHATASSSSPPTADGLPATLATSTGNGHVNGHGAHRDDDGFEEF
jgi:methyl-accepting chemotaxis protein